MYVKYVTELVNYFCNLIHISLTTGVLQGTTYWLNTINTDIGKEIEGFTIEPIGGGLMVSFTCCIWQY